MEDMTERILLPLQTADGRPLVHAYERHVAVADSLLMVFPGDHYGVDGPLLYYPLSLLEQAGWDTLAMTYGYQSNAEALSLEKVPALLQEAQSTLEMTLQLTAYKRIALIGKSLGAFVVAYLAAHVKGAESARCVYLTPPIDNAHFLSSFMATGQASCLVIGTADRYYDAEKLQEIRTAKDVDIHIFQDADHSLNRFPDMESTLDALRQVTEKVVRFVEAGDG
jgi:dienelactone hydrolase